MNLRWQATSRMLATRATDDRGMMSIVMLVIIVGMGLGALMVPIVVTQSRSTSHTDSRVQALHAAEAGIDAMLGRVRDATIDGVTALAARLPSCDSANPLAWSAPAGSPTTGYSATVQYFTSDPLIPVPLTTTKPDPMSCASGSIANTSVPSFARITSVGTASTGGSTATRTLLTTYRFSTADAPTTGGQIRLDPRAATNPLLCMDAPSALPTASVFLSACSTPATQSQLFVYSSDLSLHLLSSTSSAAPYGLCVDSVGGTISLTPCFSPGNAAGTQQWSLDDNDAFVKTLVDPLLGPLCLTRSGTAVLPGTFVQLKGCPGRYDAFSSWLPTPSAGAGAAGAASGQLVNFSQFGRCAQITNPITPSAPYVILYPCKQYPRTTPVDWYQQFVYNSTTQQWVTTNPAARTRFCLTSTGTTGTPVTIAACDTSASMQRWTEFGVTVADHGNAAQWLYPQQYTIVDQNGLCLSLTPTSGASADWFVPTNTMLQYSKLTSETCDGSPRQKWNADPDENSATVQNTSEK